MGTLFELLPMLPDQARAWLANALADIAKGEDPRPALGLDADTRRAERDRRLRQAAALLQEETAWQCACRIEGHLSGHRASRLTGTALALLDQAEQAARIPRSARQLYEILTHGGICTSPDRDHSGRIAAIGDTRRAHHRPKAA